MDSVTFCCDVYHKNEKAGRLEIVDGKLIKNEVYTNDIMIHPCPNSHTFMDVTGILSDRVACESRWSEQDYKDLGVSGYNIYEILHATHGVDVDDFNWFKFDDDRENLTWDDVKVRG
jgi:hypothetical protein